MALAEWVNGRVFNLVHRNNLVYNTCWEDPRLDRVALRLGPEDNVLVITSAGCNALDYALQGPRHVYAVDMNPRQNAVLDLKLAAIRRLEFEDFFQMFGRGRLPDAVDIYQQQLRSSLSEWSRMYWDRWIRFFDNRHRPFYYRGTSRTFAKLMNLYVDRVIHVRQWVDAILDAATVEEQRYIYDEYLRDRFWTRTIKFAMRRDTTLSMVGVPKAQRQQVERDYDGGIVKFVQVCVEAGRPLHRALHARGRRARARHLRLLPLRGRGRGHRRGRRDPAGAARSRSAGSASRSRSPASRSW